MASIVEKLKNSYVSSSFLLLSPKQAEAMYLESYDYIMSGGPKRLDDQDKYSIFEHHFYLSMIVNKDEEAQSILRNLTDRFGEDSQRICLLKSIYIECTEGVDKALDSIKNQSETNLGAQKRKVAILLSSGKRAEAMAELLKLADNFPTDAEIWSQLATMYLESGMFAQSLFALHEVLLVYPLAYNICALIGEIGLKFADSVKSTGGNNSSAIEERLIESAKFFLRSIELCEDYVRGWAGVLTSTKKILEIEKPTRDISKYKKLNQVAKEQLATIVKKKEVPESDISAAKLLLEM
ncbi:hypothetical protein V1511DRAFT_502598 [Dipodascopsis uninucleata]